MLLIKSSAFAINSIQQDFILNYGLSTESVLNNCSTCHSPALHGFLNDYGNDLKNNNMDFSVIEALDSDKDGTSNLEEISEGSWPGSFMRENGDFIYTKTRFAQHVKFNHREHVGKSLKRGEGCDACHIPEIPKYYTDSTVPRPETNVPNIFHKQCRDGCHRTALEAERQGQCALCHSVPRN